MESVKNHHDLEFYIVGRSGRAFTMKILGIDSILMIDSG